MKIVYFITKSHWGGAAKYVTDLALGLNQNAFEICVAAGGVNQLKEKSEAFGIKYREISHFGRRVALIADLFSFFEVLYILYSERPSIIHVNSSKAGGVCGLAGFLYRLSGKKLKMIFTAHGWAFHESRPKFHLSLIRIASKISCLFYDKIICFIPESSQYLKALDIFVLPSRKEGFPYALLEASLAKLPIVATTVGGNLDIINSDKTGILIPPEIRKPSAQFW